LGVSGQRGPRLFPVRCRILTNRVVVVSERKVFKGKEAGMDQTSDERIARVLEEIRDALLREIDAPMTASPVNPAALPEPVKSWKRRKSMPRIA
jgi:hypothetical protein